MASEHFLVILETGRICNKSKELDRWKHGSWASPWAMGRGIPKLMRVEIQDQKEGEAIPGPVWLLSEVWTHREVTSLKGNARSGPVDGTMQVGFLIWKSCF